MFTLAVFLRALWQQAEASKDIIVKSECVSMPSYPNNITLGWMLRVNVWSAWIYGWVNNSPDIEWCQYAWLQADWQITASSISLSDNNFLLLFWFFPVTYATLEWERMALWSWHIIFFSFYVLVVPNYNCESLSETPRVCPCVWLHVGTETQHTRTHTGTHTCMHAHTQAHGHTHSHSMSVHVCGCTETQRTHARTHTLECGYLTLAQQARYRYRYRDDFRVQSRRLGSTTWHGVMVLTRSLCVCVA